MPPRTGRPNFTPEFIEQLRLKLIKWIKIPTNWWICDFAIENDIWEQRISEFANKNELFAETLKKAQQIQKSRLVKLSLARKVDTTMAIFALKNVAGWRDTQDIKHTGNQQTQVIIIRPQEKENASNTIRIDAKAMESV